MASLHQHSTVRVRRPSKLRYANAAMVWGLLATTGCIHAQPAATSLFKSHALAHHEPGGPTIGFVVENAQSQQRTVTGDPDIPRPVEHVWAPAGHLAFLIPPYGPVQIVMKDQLAAWIGGGPPTHSIHKVEPNGPAKLFSDLRWTAEGDLMFTASCCGSTAEVRVEVPSGALRLGAWTPVHPSK